MIAVEIIREERVHRAMKEEIAADEESCRGDIEVCRLPRHEPKKQIVVVAEELGVAEVYERMGEPGVQSCEEEDATKKFPRAVERFEKHARLEQFVPNFLFE